LAFLILVLTLFIEINVYEPKNYENKRVYCSSFLTTNDSNVIFLLYSLILSDITISLMDFCLLLFNKRKIRDCK
jgi:hypothetical protein